MAVAIICDHCGKAVKTEDPRATATWATLSFGARAYANGEEDNVSRAHVCGAACAEAWTLAELSKLLPFRTKRGY